MTTPTEINAKFIELIIKMATVLQAVSSIILLVVAGLQGESNVTTAIVCFLIWVATALMLIPTYVIKATVDSPINSRIWLKFTVPVLTLGYLIYYVVQLVRYRNDVSSSQMPLSYYTLTYILVALMAIQSWGSLSHTRTNI